jgi:hypothetical protein
MVLVAGQLTAYGTATNGPDIVKTRCYTDSTTGTEILHGTWTNDNTLYFEWTDPNSPSDDTFYYELNHSSGNTIGFSDEATTTVNHVEITLPNEADNWWFHVAAKNGAGTEGPQGKPRKILIKYDCTEPSDPSVTSADPPIDTLTNDNSVDLTWNEGTDTDGSGVDGYSWVVDKVPDTVPDQTLEGVGLPSTISLGSGDGDYYIHVRTKDNAGNWTSAYHYGPWKLDTTPPAVDITTPSDGAVINGPVTIDADIIDDHPDEVSVKIDGSEVATSLPYTWDTTVAPDGSHTLTVEATDKAGNVGTDSITVTVDNHPTAEFSAFPISGDEPLAVSFTDHSSSVHGITSWSWNFGDGSTSGEQNPTHVYRQQGTYTVRLTVTEADDDGDADTETKTDYITVGDTCPTALLSGDTNINEGAAGHYDANGSSGYDAPLTYEWDWNYDGTTFNPSGDTGATQNHAWADNGTYTVAVRVTDSDGSTDIATLTVTVDNVAPVVNAGVDQTANEGETVSLDPARFTDAGTCDTHTATIDWGDGTPVEAGVVTESPFGPPGNTSGADGTVAGSHVYADNGIYTVTVTVTDDDGGGIGNDTFTVTVNNVAPTVNAGADQTVNDGDTVSLAPATFNDKGTLDTHTATIDWGDGTPIDTGTVTESPFGPPGSTSGTDGTVASSHTYVGFVGPFHVYTVTVTITDDDTGLGADTFNVHVNDVGKPSTTLTVTPPDPDNNPNPYFEWTGTDDHSLPANLACSYRMDEGAWSAWSAPGVNYVTLNGLTEGSHTFQVRAKDEAGNIGAAASYTWVLDFTGPEIRLNVPEDNAEYGLNEMVNSDWAAVDPLSGVDTATAADDANTNMVSGEPFYTGSVGLHDFTVTATDYAGNTTAETVTYRVVYTVLPGGAAGGGGGAGEGEGTPGFLDKSIAGGGGAVGITTLEAIYTVGDVIHVSFSLTDADGEAITEAVVSCTLVKVALGKEETYEVLNLWKFIYDSEIGLYLLDIKTEGLTPGIYDFWLGFDDGTQKRLRIQLEEGEER